MKQISLQLPPFAPDYSGACSALFELGGMIVIHDACGCTGNYTGFDEPRWYDGESQVYCSALRQMDASMGDDEKLIGRVLRAAEDMHPKFIALMGSPVPTVIGTDFAGIAEEIQQRSGIPAFGFLTTGLRLYDVGASEAFLALVKRFARPGASEPKAKTVNLLGLTPMDFYVGGTVKALHSALEQQGWNILASIAMDTDLEKIRDSVDAQINLVVSQSGLAMAEYYKDMYNIPYVVGLPVGSEAADELFSMLEQSAEDGQNRILSSGHGQGNYQTVILGERVICNSIRRCLEVDCGLEGVAAVGIFSPEPRLMGSDDLSATCEDEIETLLNESGCTRIIGDPLFKRLLANDNKAEFFEFPIPAVSSKLYWNQCVPIIGDQIFTWLPKMGRR